MPASHRQLVEVLRAMHGRPGGTGAVLNLLRAAEVRGTADAAVLSDLVADPARKLELARHACDEGRHAYVLLQRITDLGFRPFRLSPELDCAEGLLDRSRARDVKQIYAERGVVGEAELMELTMATLIPERDTFAKLRANYEVLGDDPRTQAIVGSILSDEERHVAYLENWLTAFERRFSRRAVLAARERLEETFAQLGARYYAALRGYFERAAA